MNFRGTRLMNYLMVLVFLLLDQIAKIFVFYKFPYNVSVPRNGILAIHTIFNEQGSYVNAQWHVGYSQWLYLLMNVMMLLFLIWVYNSLNNKKEKLKLGKKYDIFWCLLNAGILASIFDKVFWGRTLDFISIKNLVICDIKDCYYLCGVAGLIILLFYSEIKEKYNQINDQI